MRLIGEEFSKMTVGDTKNTAVYFAPENASNKELVWETDNPEAVGIVGDTELSRGIRALAPAKNVRITAKSKENGEIYVDKYITIEGKPSEIKAEKFVPGEKKREIPYGMLGMSVSYEMSALNGGTDAETIRQYEKENIPYWHEMKIRQFRKCFDNYDFVNGKADGQNGGGGRFRRGKTETIRRKVFHRAFGRLQRRAQWRKVHRKRRRKTSEFEIKKLKGDKI